jgi:hypothetical protein
MNDEININQINTKTMKTTILSVMMLIAFISNAQKKNGTVYIEHPAIDIVQNFVNASVSGDKSKMASYLTDDFRGYNGTSNDLSDKGMDKEAFPGSYPDAIEYNKDNPDGEVWVQTWNIVKGVHKTTGVKIDAAAHRLYTLTKDNKIKTIITYGNGQIIDEIRASFADRTNGTIYNHHENINTIRKMIYAFEHKDLDKAYTFYDENARFIDSSSPSFEGNTLTEQKELDKKIFEKYDITSIDMVGYPDYLHYEMGDARVVQSWWNINLIRKSDKKAIVLPVHYLNDFNKEGKITSEMAYYDPKLLD